MTLNLQIRDRIFGQTIAEYIQTIPGELPIDAVGLWQIIPAGRERFSLETEDLTEFVYRCVLALLQRGAKPVVGGHGTKYDWILQTQYGKENEEIAHAVVAEWVTSGRNDCDPGGIWFALPTSHVGYED